MLTRAVDDIHRDRKYRRCPVWNYGYVVMQVVSDNVAYDEELGPYLASSDVHISYVLTFHLLFYTLAALDTCW